MAVSKALRKNAAASQRDPGAVFKGMNPSFISEFGQFFNGLPQNQAMTGFASQVSQVLSEFTGKTIALTSPLATGLVPYDLLSPSRLIYPIFSPLRNKLPRTQGQGTSRRLKVFTGVSGSHTGGTSVLRWSIPEFPGGGGLSGSQWPNQLPGAGTQTAVDVNIPYQFFGLTESLSWLSQFAGQGFEDVSALANLILLQEAMAAEEHQILQGNYTALAAPAASLTARAAATGETAITGATSNIYVKVTATNFYGESVVSAQASTAFTSGVVDVTITPSAGAAQYNVYVTTGTAAGTYYLVASGVGGHKYTIQGALPTGGTQPPTADSGTSSTTDYDGLFNILTGHTRSATYPATGFKAGYINSTLGTTITTAALFDAFAGLYDNSSTANTSDSGGFRADPSELITEALDASNFANNILTQSSGGQQAYQLRIAQNEVGNITAGAAISQIQNPMTRSMVSLLIHPYLQQGNAMLMSYQLPMSFSNVSNAWEITNVQDYLSINWPVVDVTFRFSIFLYGTLCAVAPQYSGIIQGIQKTGSTANGNWT